MAVQSTRDGPAASLRAETPDHMVDRLQRELDEAAEQQDASSRVLAIIAAGPTDAKTVFDAILENALRICEAEFGNLMLVDGERFYPGSLYNAPPQYARLYDAGPYRPGEHTGLGRLLRTKQLVHIPDLTAGQAYIDRDPLRLATIEILKARSFLAVPMLKGEDVLGAIVIYRQELQPFTEKQIKLVQTFANQAVIAVANMQLVDQLRQRTGELTDALEQQTGTAEVLKVISSSHGNLAPVFDAILVNAARICGATLANLIVAEGGDLKMAAMYGAPQPFGESMLRDAAVPSFGPGATVIATQQPLHVEDLSGDPRFAAIRLVKLAKARTTLGVPMIKHGRAIGAVLIYRQEVRPFTDKQIALLQNFAAQAVIAIENARLLNELRWRTDDLSKALEQQTATAQLLEIINSSGADLAPVFDTLLEKAVKLCEAQFGNLFLFEDGQFRVAAMYGATSAYADARHVPILLTELHPDVPLARVARTKALVEIADSREDPSYLARDPRFVELVEFAGARSMVIVPMLKDGRLIGAIPIYRKEVRPFSERQIALVSNFAAQAVIAIENARLLKQLRESLEQQTAASEVLEVIASATGELAPVFKAVLANAAHLCDAAYGALWLREGDAFRTAALHGNLPSSYVEQWRSGTLFRPDPNVPLARVAVTSEPVQVADLRESEAYHRGDRLVVTGVDDGGIRTIVAVPMLKENDLIGVIAIYRREVRPFTSKQIEVVTNFAAQAVIAIENARLLKELRQRTEDLTESLAQQTATADVLKVISRSTFDLEPVFDTLLESAARLCDGHISWIFQRDGNILRWAASYGHTPEVHARVRDYFKPLEIPVNRGSVVGRAATEGGVVHISDVLTDPEYTWGGAQKIGGYRACLGAPLLREGNVVGVLFVAKTVPQPFSDKQIELVKTFADQAVIAIENTRLFNELRESLQQQTATADVLKVISRSTFELPVVLQTLTESAVRLCAADRGVLFQREGDAFLFGSSSGFSAEAEQYALQNPIALNRDTVTGRAALQRKTIQIPDVVADPEYKAIGYQKAFGFRTTLGVPLIREGNAIGVFTLTRDEVSPFTAKQVELATMFADQAMIAIENARLLAELRESLQQQTATADVLKLISRSAFDLQTVLDTLIRSAARLCDADQGTITRQVNDKFYRAATCGFSAEFSERVKNIPVQLDRSSASGRALIEKRIVHIPDVQADPDYTFDKALRLGNFRTAIGIPMLREENPIGALALTRKEVRPFTEKQIELVTTFADQAAIAIENVRLFESIEARTRELAQSLEDLQTAQDRLVQTQKLASLGQLTAGIAHEIKNPLNFVNNFSSLSTELLDELQDVLKRTQFDGQMRAEIDDLVATLRANLGKIEQHGKRADSIVKNMLLHSREGSGEHRATDINAVVEESLNLAYHGARAEKQGFNITLERSFDPSAGEVDLFPQEITRVLLNLISNGFYAATKRKAEATDRYEPILSATTKSLGDRVEIRIRDNGIGIPPEVKDRIFNPFFTTKPAGEGTGLGLSLSHDIIVKQHAGMITVETEPGEFTEFRITLPRTAASLAKTGGRA
jgi:GAF domain-containing protein